MMRYLLLLLSLLCALGPAQSFGQASSPIPRQEGVGGWKAFCEGGCLRTCDPLTQRHTGPWYILVDGGLSDLLSANFVDGYSLGPAATWGYSSTAGWRLEVDEVLRWAFSRNQLLAYGELRYFLPVERQTRFTLFGGRITRSFDPDPIMPYEHSILVEGLFGWDKQKYYELTNVGLRAEIALGSGFSLDAALQWRQTCQKSNSISHSLLGTRSRSNFPVVRGDTLFTLTPITRMRPHLDVALSWQAGQTLYVVDDLTSYVRSRYPRLTLRAISSLPDDFLSLEMRVQQECDGLSYLVAAGWYPIRHEVQLYDCHHLDATRFPWTTQRSLTWFSLLDEYELSTDRAWAEAHVEYCRGYYLQLHQALIPHRSHTELSLGWEFSDSFRLGTSLGWDHLHYDGIAFDLVLGI